ncbi:MAG: hypothetical protein HY934_03310 [Candidatus Firestonebacteria bacterium]|nr:hypothetical protein [Candidatus Firestonebacteria bacterium]
MRMGNKKLYTFIIYLFISILLIKTEAQEKKNSSQSASGKKKQTESLTPIVNIHNSGYKCDECHKKEAIEGIDSPETVILQEGDNIIALCNKCHKGDNLHPVGKDPLLAKMSVKIPVYFPLGIKGENRGKVVCTTCHLIHALDARDKLLRGFTYTTKKNQPIKEAAFKDRREMCMSCHEKEFIEKSPHKKEEAICIYCHTTDPSKQTKEDVLRSFSKDISKLCTFCHEQITEKHFEKNNPLKDEDIKYEIAKSDLFMVDNKYVCTTCHDPHGETDYPKFLRENYVAIAEKSKFLNPHWKGIFCLSCHVTKPEEGQKGTIKFNGNVNYMCMSCHILIPTAVADIHPVNITPKISEFIKIPQNFPLTDNKITCITCHDPRLQEKADKALRNENRQFLRGLAYTMGETRSDVCFQCHIQQQFSMLNAHDQIDDQGEFVEDSCKYCHTSPPDRDTEGLEKIDPTITNLSGLCFRCHSDGPHPGKKNHIVKITGERLERKIDYEKKNDVTYPLDSKGGIFCATCHNPHETGIVKSLRADKGADTNRRARLPIEGGHLCFTCHDKDKEPMAQFVPENK